MTSSCTAGDGGYQRCRTAVPRCGVAYPGVQGRCVQGWVRVGAVQWGGYRVGTRSIKSVQGCTPGGQGGQFLRNDE